MISSALKGKIKTNSIVVTDSKSSYKNFCKKENLKLIQIPSGYHKFENYTVNDVNEIIAEIELYLRIKKGISSRHLQHHMNFISYRKFIKYTIEYLNINELIYKKIILLHSNLKSKDV